MTSDVKSYVTELKNINDELKALRFNTMKLNRRKKELEDKLVDYLDKNDQNGVKFKGTAVIKEEKDKHIPLKKKEKNQTAISLLQENGVRNPEKVYKELIDKLRGDVVTKKVIKLKNITA